MNKREQTVQDVAMIARNAIDKIIEMERRPANEPQTYRKGVLVGPCFCGSWPGGVPPVRQWVGLTEPERLACYDLNPARFASAIENALKEKNT